ncbi:hypothetical protein [Prosthecobacter sp.]|uniref:hypothetical protein n=1 Tax=Prosthecobacter sp. TaxID=1965333 RepID=UPI003784D629
MKYSLPLFSAAAALLLATPASADTTIRITGSTAFRAAAMNGIKNLFTGSPSYAYNGSSYTGATVMIMKGTVSGISGTTTIKTNWSGSAAGIRDVSNQNSIRFLKDSTTVSTGSGTSGAALSNDVTDDISPPDIAFADNTQDSTIYTDNTLTATQIGIIPFGFVVSGSAPAAITGITSQQANALFTTGYLSAMVFTNNPADDAHSGGTLVYALGRDPFSGTRIDVFAESSVGISTTAVQYRPNATSGTNPAQTITAVELTPVDNTTDPLFPVVAGNNGESSGGILANNIRYLSGTVANNATGTSTPTAIPSRTACFLSYMGEGDLNTAVNGASATVNAGIAAGAANAPRFLKYNGASAFGGQAFTFTANCGTTSGSAVVSIPSATTTQLNGLVVGQLIRCATGQIPADSTIVSIDSANKTITVSANATATSSTATIATSIILPANIWNGSYTLWGYEYTMLKPGVDGSSSGADLDKFNYYTSLTNQVKNTDYFASGLGLTSTALKVRRLTDGGVVKPKFGF